MTSTLPLLLTSALALSAGPGVGGRIGDFSLPDPGGRVHRLADHADARLVVVVFFGVECPLAKLYGPRLQGLAEEYGPRGVAFVGIDSNQQDPAEAIAEYGRVHGITFPLLKDEGNVVADRFGARRTPEAFILDAGRVLRYRGRIDSQYEVGLQKQKVTRRDLAEALDELLAGKPVSRPVTEAPGCIIGRVSKKGQGTVTYCRDIAPLLQNHCQRCHRPGQVAPFSLLTYDDGRAWSGMIREVVRDGRMPPWGANPAHGKFANDPSLSPGDKEKLFAWIKAGCPEGDPADLPPPREFADGWELADPDVVVSIPETFTVPAEGIIEYQHYTVDPGFTEDRWVRAAEVRPGNRAVVHHCNVFLLPPGTDRISEAGTLGSICLAAMAPGTPPMILPDGMAKRVPAGWRFLFVVHYVSVGSKQSDRTSLALKFADPATVRKEVATKLMYETDLCIPPGEADHVVSQTWQVNDDVLLFAFFPHLHLRGKSFRYEALRPDGRTEILLDVPRWDFNWQYRYVLAEPKRLPAGSRLRCTAVYDNSAANPANPDPKATVRTGPQTWDEMFNGYFDVALADQDLTHPPPLGERAWGWVKAGCRPGLVVLYVLAGGLWLVRRRVQSRKRLTPPCPGR